MSDTRSRRGTAAGRKTAKSKTASRRAGTVAAAEVTPATGGFFAAGFF